MARPTSPLEKNQAQDEKEIDERAEQSDRLAIATEAISGRLESLSSQLAAFGNQLQADNETEHRERRECERSELYWTERAARAGIIFSICSLILSALTSVILYKTL